MKEVVEVESKAASSATLTEKGVLKNDDDDESRRAVCKFSLTMLHPDKQNEKVQIGLMQIIISCTHGVLQLKEPLESYLLSQLGAVIVTVSNNARWRQP